MCQKTYNLEQGCVFCEQAKKHIIWPDEFSSDLNSLDSMAAQSIRILQANLDRLERDMDSTPTKGFYDKHAVQAGQLARAMATILSEARKLEDRNAKAVQRMGYEERAELFLDFVEQLPPELKNKTLGKAVRMLEADNSAPADIIDE
jgi:hypothetical protein